MYRKRGELNRCFEERAAFEACASKNLGVQFRAPVKPFADTSDL
jgi:hypothetical protein